MSELFTPFRIGPIELKNRTIRSAAFEAMCPGQRPSKELFDYHTAVARGGIGMTTVAYAAVCRSGLSYGCVKRLFPNSGNSLMQYIAKAQKHPSNSDTVEICPIEASADVCRTEPAEASTSTLLHSFRK